MLSQLSQYQNELLALGAVVILILILIIIKKRNSNSKIDDIQYLKEHSQKGLNTLAFQNDDVDDENADLQIHQKIKKERVKENFTEVEDFEPQEEIKKRKEDRGAPIILEEGDLDDEDEFLFEEEIEDEPKNIQNYEDEKSLEDELISMPGAEEGDFGITPTFEEEEQNRTIQEQQTPSIVQQNTIAKREVPPHGKISKEHFKEFAGKRILLAEDNIINQKVIMGLLAESGIEIVIADDGQIALDILEKDTDFMMVLMDAHMPRVDGFEATRAIRANPKLDHIVVVALSGDTAADDIKKMSEAGMAEHLEKPLKMDALYDVLYAYSGTQQNQEEESDDEEYVEIVITKSLNGEKGLAVCGGDNEFYSDILNEFIDSYKDSSKRLLEMLKSHDFAAADKLLLDIIGISANIGAESLHKTAQTLKEAVAKKDSSNISALLQKYHKQLQELITDIKEYL